MKYIDEIFWRADIQQIREFLLHGAEAVNTNSGSCKERTERALKRVTVQLHETYPEEEEYERVAELVYDCVSAFEDVYMGIGLQTGTIIAAQVCQNLRTAFEGE